MLTDLLHRLRAIFKRNAVETELSDELRFHLDQQTQRYIDGGLTPDEAMRRARLSLGGFEQVQEECRQARGVSALETTAQDVRYAARMLRKSPGFTVVVALSLALGIGANTAIFSLIDAVMLRMLPVREPEKLFLIGSTAGGQTWYGLTYSQYRLLRDRNQVLTELAVYSPVRLNLSIDGSTEPTAEGQMVSGNYFPALGVNPVAGRAIGMEDDQAPNAHPVAMISHGYWKRRFGLDRAAIGRTIHLSGVPFTIIGVTPPEFFGLEVGAAPDIFVPVMMQPTVMPAFENLLDNPIIMRTWLKPVGRLKSGVNVTQAASELTALHLQSPEFANFGRGGKQPPFGKPKLVLSSAARGLSDLRQQFSQSLRILMAVVGVVLLIACANTANLLLARAAARRSEFAMRLALGASRFRLMRQLLVESVLLSMLGGVLGIGLARWGTTLLVKFMSSGRTPIVVDLNLDLRMLGFTAAVAILTGILFGFAPALRASRIDLTPALKGQRGAVNSASGSLRPGKVLAIAQVALSLLLLVGAGLFVRSLQNLDSQDAGFNRDSVLIVRVEPKLSDQRNLPGVPLKLDRIYQDLLQRVETIPGVRSASLAHFKPTARVEFGSNVKLLSGEQVSASTLMVYPNYFATLGISMAGGRDFNAGDLGPNSPLVAVVNESFARRAFNGENAVGKQYMTQAYMTRGIQPCEIVGVVKDARYSNLRGDTQAIVYRPFLQTTTGRGQMVLHVRVAGNGGQITPRIREEVQKIDNTLPTFEVYTLAEEMDAALIRERLIATLSSLFGALALLLASVGLYGLMAFTVVQRTGEMGIRMALGARRGDVQWMVMRESLSLLLIGIAIGLPLALALARFASSQISGLLFGLTATDPVAIIAATAVMVVVAAIAGYLPALRASQLDPMVALRTE